MKDYLDDNETIMEITIAGNIKISSFMKVMSFLNRFNNFFEKKLVTKR